jgi:putative sterol carrier protein
MTTGELQPLVAFMQGKIRLQGDMNLAMKLQELFAR